MLLFYYCYHCAIDWYELLRTLAFMLKLNKLNQFNSLKVKLSSQRYNEICEPWVLDLHIYMAICQTKYSSRLGFILDYNYCMHYILVLYTYGSALAVAIRRWSNKSVLLWKHRWGQIAPQAKAYRYKSICASKMVQDLDHFCRLNNYELFLDEFGTTLEVSLSQWGSIRLSVATGIMSTKWRCR